MSNKRKLNKQKLPWGSLGEGLRVDEPFGDWTPFDWDGERLTLDEADYKAITGLLLNQARMRQLQRD
jgi:hypothetical protein